MAISLNNINNRVSVLENSTVTQVVQSGSSWKIKYKGGLLLQGGVTPQTSNTDTTVKFLEEFKDVSYTAVFSGSRSGTIWVGGAVFTVRDKTTTQFKVISEHVTNIDWIAIGIAKTLYYKVLESINRFFKEVIS